MTLTFSWYHLESVDWKNKNENIYFFYYHWGRWCCLGSNIAGHHYITKKGSLPTVLFLLSGRVTSCFFWLHFFYNNPGRCPNFKQNHLRQQHIRISYQAIFFFKVSLFLFKQSFLLFILLLSFLFFYSFLTGENVIFNLGKWKSPENSNKKKKSFS